MGLTMACRGGDCVSGRCRGYLNPKPGDPYPLCDHDCHEGQERDVEAQERVIANWRSRRSAGRGESRKPADWGPVRS